MDKKLISLVIILILSTNVFVGCIDNGEQEDNNDVGESKKYTINLNYPRDSLGLNSEGEAAFTMACNRYSELKSNMTEDEARNLLVDELNNGFEFIKEASLSEDGYTIAVVFEDDTAALMITFDYYSGDYSVTTGSQFSSFNQIIKQDNDLSIPSNDTYFVTCGLQFDSSDKCEVDFVVPQSKKVLIINAASLCNTYWSSYEERNVINSFQENGWTLDDIDIKKRSSLNDGNLTPDDYFDYAGYGIIMYMGHGGYCSGYEGSIPGHHYIECCDIKVNFTSIVGQERLEQYRTWRDQGRLIYGGYFKDRAKTEWEWELYMDTDLIMENAKIDPGTIVYMDSCNSDRVADAYLNNDAGCFFGFDYKADGEASAEAFYQLIKSMTNEGSSQNAADALNHLSDEVRTCSGGGKLQIYDNGKDVYLPSFGKTVLKPDSPPAGTSYYEIEFSPYGTTETLRINTGEEIEYDGVSPVNTTITIRAKGSTGNIVETGIYKPELRSGENELFTINTWDTYGIILKADPISVKADGEETSTITATLKTWRDTDVLEPTGDAIACKELEFITNLGFFTESEKVYTDQYGKATIELASNKEGIATVRAIVEDDEVESYKNVDVTFGDLPYSFKLVSRIKEEASGWNGQNIKLVYGWRYWLVFQGTPNVEYYTITIHLNDYPLNEGQVDHEEHITQGIYMPSVSKGWLTPQQSENWTEDFNNGYRFYEIGGIDHYSYEAGVTDVSSKQNEYHSKITKWTFEIEPYVE